jgi:hypothetical protein
MNLPFHYEGSRHIAGTSPIPSLERFRVLLHSLTMLGDVVMLAAAMELAGFLYLGEWLSEYSVLSTVLMVPIFIIISVYSGTYSLASLNRFRTAARRMVIALSVSAALLHFVAFFLRASEQLSRAVFALGFLIALCAMLAMRYAANRWIRRNAGPNLSNVLLIDAGGPRVSAQYLSNRGRGPWPCPRSGRAACPGSDRPGHGQYGPGYRQLPAGAGGKLGLGVSRRRGGG